MALITAETLLKLQQDGILKSTLSVKKDDILTPSAREFLANNQIEIKNSEDFVTVYGLKTDKKPEQMTHLHGNFLVPKNHPRIILRGKLDSLESEVILAQIVAKEESMQKTIPQLEEIISLIRKIIRAEVKDEPLEMFTLAGLDENEIHEHSHHPSKYYGIRHFLPTHTHGKMVAVLNRLRTLTREVEIAAFNAFEDSYHCLTRTDIIMALNRLSSMFWVMMFKTLKDEYK